jgi:GMP synthase-like glutamine amidotransferase
VLCTIVQLLCLTHVAFEGPARVADWARDRGHDLAVARADLSSELAPPQGLGGLVVMGGPMSANDSFPWMRRELAFIERVLGQGLAVLGVCLGAQMLAHIFGARVYRAAHKEIGWWPVQGLPNAGTGAVELPESFVPLHWHGETFELPRGAIQLAESQAIANQAFLLDSRVLGLQFHVEATPDSVRAIAQGAGTDISDGPYEQAAPAMIAECDARCAALQGPCYSLLDGFFNTGVEPVKCC